MIAQQKYRSKLGEGGYGRGNRKTAFWAIGCKERYRHLSSLTIFLYLIILGLAAAISGCTYIPAKPRTSIHTLLDINPRSEPPGSMAFEQAMDRLTDTLSSSGNEVRLLINGDEAFPAMLEAIGNAQSRIAAETYILTLDRTGRQVIDALAEASRRGVKVRLLYDDVGSKGLRPAAMPELKDAGVEIKVFNPVKNWTVVRINNRDHRKILVVDGAVAFLGGMNYADEYNGDGISRGWRDTHLRISGPAARDAENVFAASWLQGGVGFLGKDLPIIGAAGIKRAVEEPLLRLLGQAKAELPSLPATAHGDARVRIVASSPESMASRIFDMYILAINSAQKRVWITNAYFIPPLALRRALCDAAARGVDVRMILAGPTDVPTIKVLSTRWYGVLMKAGARIYEWQPSVLHAKCMVVDGIWVTIGSANLDSRALFLNYEINAAVTDSDLAAAAEKQFQADLSHCKEISYEEWRQRSLGSRAREIMLAPIEGQM